MNNNSNIPFQTIDWSMVEATVHPGHSMDGGTGIDAIWRTVDFPGLRIRLVEYPAGYIANHWCRKGHLVYCLEGEFVSEQENGEQSPLKEGMSYIVSDEMSTHRSFTKTGVKLIIIDGDFLAFRGKD